MHTGLKKDPGIPNLFPLKEQILKQMEDRKRQAQSQKEKEKLVRQQEAKKKKKKSLQSLQNDALKRTKEFEKKVSKYLYRMSLFWTLLSRNTVS